jgi:hypothetical protein
MTVKGFQCKIGTTTINHLLDYDPNISYLDQDGFEERKEQYHNDVFSLMGINVETEIHTSLDNGKNWLINHISSGGLWGIESDSGEEYLKNVAIEEMSELRTTLAGMGFSETAIKRSFDNAVTKE